MKIKKEEEPKLTIRNESGDEICLKSYQTWGNLRILQEAEGKYVIVSSNEEVSEFCYESIEFKEHYLLAYLKKDEYFHVYDANEILYSKSTDEILIGKTLDNDFNNVILVRTHEDKGALVQDGKVDYFKNISLIVYDSRIIGFIALTLEGELGLYSLNSLTHQVITNFCTDYELEKNIGMCNGNKVIKIRIYTEKTNDILSFELSGGLLKQKEIISSFDKLNLVRIEGQIKNWLGDRKRYILCQVEKTVLYDLYTGKKLETEKPAEGVVFSQEEIRFTKKNENGPSLTTEIYNENFEKLLDVPEGLYVYEKALENELKGWWKAYDDSTDGYMYFLTRKQCIKMRYNHEIDRNYIVNQCKDDGYEVYRIEEQEIKKIDIEKEYRFINYSLVANNNVAYVSIYYFCQCYYTLYVEEIAVIKNKRFSKRKKLQKLEEWIRYNQSVFVDEYGFVIIPGLNKKFFLAREEKKAYSKFHPRYWKEWIKSKK